MASTSIRNMGKPLQPVPDDMTRPFAWGPMSHWTFGWAFTCHHCALRWAVWMSENDPDFISYRVRRKEAVNYTQIIPVRQMAWLVSADIDLLVRHYVRV